MDFDELKERVKRGRYKVVKIIYGRDKSHNDKAALYCLDEEFITSQLDDFGKTFKGDFTAYFKQTKGQAWKNAEVVNFSLGFADYELLSAEPTSTTETTSYEDLKAKILAEIKAEQDQQIQAERIKELEEERERAKTISVQLAAVGSELLKKLFPKQMQAINQTFNGTTAEEYQNSETMDEQTLVQAYEDLTEILGAENLPKIVVKLREQPHLAQMILGML